MNEWTLALSAAAFVLALLSLILLLRLIKRQPDYERLLRESWNANLPVLKTELTGELRASRGELTGIVQTTMKTFADSLALAQTQTAFAQTRQQFCGDGLQDSFCIFIAVRIFLAERVAASARLLQSGQQCFLRTLQHRQRVKHRCCAHLAAGQEDTAPADRHRRHRGHCCQVTFRGHFRLHLQLQPEHRFCLFHVHSFF